VPHSGTFSFREPMKKHQNRLSEEPSIYLRQHAQNPVDWYPWGTEAFAKAITENKPVLVSIGYSACHWCHVMERESFEDEGTAALMNELFVNIKVDREERPDLDQIYMDAVQAMTGSGGWPLNVFLTPEKKPFYGGTYFPPVPAFNRPSWKELIRNLSETFNNQRPEIEEQAERLTRQLQDLSPRLKKEVQPVIAAPIKDLFDTLMRQADMQEGGFGGAPKFPATFQLRFLLYYYRLHHSGQALEHVQRSLDHMIAGGIYDQIGGGFCRYATDRSWLVPHFEKMLYDNALLVELASEAYQLTHNEAYFRAVSETLEYISREMAEAAGGYFSALDADSEGEEGKYYVWEKQEIERVLAGDVPWFCEAFDVSARGNWEGKNILHLLRPLQPDERGLLEATRKKLLAFREMRIRPVVDDKVLLSWNALMCSAYCKAFATFGDPRYRDAAVRNAAFIWDQMKDPEGPSLYHCWQSGKARQPAFLDDYAFLVQALISLQEITADRNYLLQAKMLTDHILERFWDEEKEYFYYTPSEQDDLIVRRIEIYDGATPSGNAVMCRNLQYLGAVFDNSRYQQMASAMAAQTAGLALRYPSAFGVWATDLMELEGGLQEIAIVGENYEDLLLPILREFIPCRVLMAAPQDDDRFILLQGRHQPGKTLIYVCRNQVCAKPVENPEEALQEALNF
jgi:uncharacterized protein YyaL (SSP411 family)